VSKAEAAHTLINARGRKVEAWGLANASLTCTNNKTASIVAVQE
jgi:hypothetical protein